MMRPVNGYLVGIIAEQHPDTDHEKHEKHPPVLSEDVAVLDPRLKKQFVVHLGEKCEVLWIEESVVYYRLGDDLYRARLVGEDFVDRQLLLTDPRVGHIHWAFSG